MAKHIVKKKLKKSAEAEIKAANVIAAADPVYHGKSKFQVKAGELLLALAGALVGAIGTECIMIPNGLTYGGVTGLSRMVQNYTGLNYSVAYYIFSALIVLFVLATLGFKEVRKIILISVAYPTMMLGFEMIGWTLELNDAILAAIFTGVLFGVSNGMIFQAGYSSGGTDSIAKVIKMKKLQHKGINEITSVINSGIILISMVVFGIKIGMYALVEMYIAMKVGEAVMLGFSQKLVQLEVQIHDPKPLVEYVMNEIGRGVSSHTVVGEFTGEERKMLRIICSPRESILIKKFIADLDSRAFVSVIAINSVWGIGRGFKDINSPEV